MWSALRSDLKEFASSIATDSTAVIDTIESKLVTENENESDDEGSTDREETGQGEDMLIGENGEVTYVGAASGGYASTGVISDAADEALRRSDDEDTYMVPLLVNEVNGAKKERQAAEIDRSDDEGVQDEIDNDEETEDAPAVPVDAISNEVSSVQIDRTVALADDDALNVEDESVIDFLQTFDIQSKTDEISAILSDQATSVGNHFENLVPVVVTYEQFWQRYYYRCDPERIQQEWDEEDERVRQERKQLIDKGKKAVGNLFGGAFKAIKGVGSKDEDAGKEQGGSIFEKYQAELGEKQRALMEGPGPTESADQKPKSGGFGLGLLRGARPPFVMNTAVDEDDDSEADDNEEEASAEEDEDDGEFGWGSDDDLSEGDEEEEYDEDNEDDNDGTSEASEEIVFGSPSRASSTQVDSVEMSKLREELAKALELKDQLQQSVEMQSKQLQGVTGGGTSKIPSMDAETEQLKLMIFEKDAELAAVKASLEEAQEDSAETTKHASQLNAKSAEIDRLLSALTAKEEELEEIRENLSSVEALQDEEDAKDNAMLAEALETITALQSELETSKAYAAQQLEELQFEQEEQMHKVRQELTITEASREEEDAEDTTALVDAMKQVDHYQFALASLQSELDASHANVAKLNEDLVMAEAPKEVENTEDKAALTDAMETIAALRSELETSKIALAAAEGTNENDDAMEIIASLQSELEASKEALAAVEASKEEECAHAKSTLADAMETIAALQSELETSTAALALAEVAKENANAHLADATDTIASLQSELEASEAALAAVVEEDAQESTALIEALATIASLQSDLETSKVDSARLQEDLATEKACMDDNAAEDKIAVADAMKTIAALQSELDSTKADVVNQVEELRSQLASTKDLLAETHTLSENDTEQLISKIQVLEIQKTDAESEAAKLKQTVQLLQEEAVNQKIQLEKTLEEEIPKIRADKEPESAPSSPNGEGSSFSSGVEVQEPADLVIKEDADEGGWGASWSDDDDDDL